MLRFLGSSTTAAALSGISAYPTTSNCMLWWAEMAVTEKERLVVWDGQDGSRLFPDCSLINFLWLLFLLQKLQGWKSKVESLLRKTSAGKKPVRRHCSEMEHLHTCADEIDLIWSVSLLDKILGCGCSFLAKDSLGRPAYDSKWQLGRRQSSKGLHSYPRHWKIESIILVCLRAKSGYLHGWCMFAHNMFDLWSTFEFHVPSISIPFSS